MADDSTLPLTLDGDGEPYGHSLSLLSQAANAQLKERRNTVVASFRIVSSTPSSRSSSGYRRQTPVPYAIRHVLLERADELNMLANSAIDNEDFEKALTYLNKAIVLDPDNADFYVERGEVYLHMCDFQSAILNLRRACILQPDCERFFMRLAFVYFLQGQTYFDEQKFEEALECFSKAVELKPDSLGYHTRSIACLAALQRHGECLALVNKRLDLEKDNPDLFVMRARLHDIFRNDSLCYFDVVDALRLHPDHTEAKKLLETIQKRSEAYKSQAMRLDLLGKQSDSISKISAAIDVNPSVPDFHVYRSALYRRNYDFNAAIDDLLIAMDKTQQKENHPIFNEAQKQLLLTYNDFAVDCFKKGFFEEAIILLNKAIKNEKTEKKLYINRGDCFFKTNELHFALSDYLQAFDLDNSDDSIKSRLASVYNELGILEYQERRYLQSEEFFSIAISYNPTLSSLYASRAKARYMLENTESAQVDVLSSLHLNSNNKEIISLFTRLFPGETTTEALKSQLGEMVGMALTSVVREISEETYEAQNASRPFSPKHVLPDIKKRVTVDQRDMDVELKSCMDEKQLAISVIKGKKKVNDLVESVMHSRQSLKFTGPRLDDKKPLAITLPLWTEKKATNEDQKVTNNTSLEHKKTTDKQYTRNNTVKKKMALTFLTA